MPSDFVDGRIEVEADELLEFGINDGRCQTGRIARTYDESNE